MTTQEIHEIVAKVVSRQLDLGIDNIKPASKLVNDLGADSLDLAEIAMDLEDEFDIMVPDDAVDSIKTIAEAVAYIEKQISSR
jgi:acyl carrier protein